MDCAEFVTQNWAFQNFRHLQNYFFLKYRKVSSISDEIFVKDFVTIVIILTGSQLLTLLKTKIRTVIFWFL